MKKGNTTLEQLTLILADEKLCKKILDQNENFEGTLSKKQYLDLFDRLLNSTVFLMKKNKNFHYLPLTIQILERFYLEKFRENPFSFYENVACVELYLLLERYPNECKAYRNFLEQIYFSNYQKQVNEFYQKQIKENRILTDFELKDFLNYLMIFKNRSIPHSYVRYLFFVLFEKDHQLKLKNTMYAELFRFLVLDIFSGLGWNDTVSIVSIKEKKAFLFSNKNFYINVREIQTTLEENLDHFARLFDLLEKRYKYKSFVHNKYEEIKSKKQYTIKEIIGSNFFYENFSYLSIEKEIIDQSLIERLRFLEEVSPFLYRQIIEDYEKQIIETTKTTFQNPSHLVLTMDDLLDQTVLLAPEVIQNQPYLQLEYDEFGRPKKISEWIVLYEKELELGNFSLEHKKLATYCEQKILSTSLTIPTLVEELVSILTLSIRFSKTEQLLDRLIREHFVEEIRRNIKNHLLTHQELEVILSKCNQYMLKFYEVKQKEISKYIVKDQKKWLQENGHLTRLYCNVEYMTRPEQYESSYLHLTQVLDTEEAREIQKKILKKKIISQRIYMAVLIVLILIFSTSLFLLARITWQYWSANKSYSKIQEQMNQKKPVPIFSPDPERTEFPINDNIPQLDFEPLQKENDEIIAWIRIDDTEVNYPVLHAIDNEYYLSRLYNRKYNISGSIFADYRTNPEFLDDNTVIYGHNMRNGSMFGSLKKYKDPSYLETHKYIWLMTPKETYQYEIYAAYEFDAIADQYTFNFSSEDSFQNYLENIKQKSIIPSTLKVTTDDHILTLSTCTEDPSDKRFVVVAKRVVRYVIPEK